MAKTKDSGSAHVASAKSHNLPISTKHSVEISRNLRYRSIKYAKSFLESVLKMEKAVPFNRFNNDVGHKPGIGSGRYPIKAASAFLKLFNSVEANAQVKGLNTSSLKIIKLLANKASIPMTGGRRRGGTKRTHIEIEVEEGKAGTAKKSEAKKKEETKSKKDEKIPVAPEKSAEIKEEPVVKEEKIVEEIAEEVKEEVKDDVPTSPETKTEEEKGEAAEKIAEEEKKPETPELIAEPESETPTEEETPIESESIQESMEEKPVVEVQEPTIQPAQDIPTEIPASTIPKASVISEPQQPASQPSEQSEPIEEVKDYTPEELLEKAQAKAAELNKDEKQTEKVKEVEGLFQQLQQKGTLRKDEGAK